MFNKSICILILLILNIVNGLNKPANNNNKKEPKKPLIFNEELLPDLQILLNQLELSKYIINFIRIGVTDTRHLLQLNDMDYRLMAYDWENITTDDITRLRNKVNEIISLATVNTTIEKKDYDLRNSLTYGRIYLQNSVQSFDFIKASFGGNIKLGSFNFIMAQEPFTGCDDYSIDLTNKIFVIQRGNCTFLTKAILANKNKAAGVIIINNDDHLESPGSGLGIDKNVTEEIVDSLSSLFIISTSNTTWQKFLFTNIFYPSLTISIVPLSCGTRGLCAPTTDEEKLLQSEVTWGNLSIASQSFQFLTSNFGGSLPSNNTNYEIVIASPLDACTPLENIDTRGKILLAYRGNCNFDIKSYHAQLLNFRLLVIVDENDKPLQRIGGQLPNAGYIGIPSILMSYSFLSYIKSTSNSIVYDVIIHPGEGTQISDEWIDIAYTIWDDSSDENLLMQLNSYIQLYSHKSNLEIVEWLNRQKSELFTKLSKTVNEEL